jgi:alkylated DNA repair dioxygenase AlkB
VKLFNDLIDETKNLLPIDGVVNYFGKIIPEELANTIFVNLLENLDWKHDEATVYGKHYITKRKVAWYGEKAFEYTYSGKTKKALPLTPGLLKLKELVELKTGETFNSCLCNLYHNGEETMGWHSDGEKDLKKHGAIASLSFGAERKFAFKHKQTKEKCEFLLEHGSLLVMTGTTQEHWLHRLPPTKKIKTPRVNLTFRTIVENN